MSFSLSLFILSGVFFTSVLSGILGMAGGMVLMGLLAWVLPVQQAMMLHATSQFFANGSRAFIHRKHLHTGSLQYYFAGMALIFGLFCLVSFMPDKVLVFFLLGSGPFIPFFLPKNMQFNFTKPGHAALCGMLVTFFQLTGGVSGPLLDIFFQKIALTRHQVIATKAFTQCASHVTKFIYFGLVAPSMAASESLPLWLYFAVVPFAILGSHLAKHVLDMITDRQFYSVTQKVLWIIGAVYLVKAIQLLQDSP